MSTVLAYLDAGTGSQIAALVAGGFAAFAVTAKLYWGRLLTLLRIRKPDAEPATEPAHSTKQPDAT